MLTRCRVLVAVAAVAAVAIASPARAATFALAATDIAIQSDWHGTSWSVPLDLSGQGTKGTKVSVSSACAIGTCTARTTVDRTGRWYTHFDAILTPGTATLAVKLTSGTRRLMRTFEIIPRTEPTPGDGTVMVIGDSLAVGTRGLLPTLLPAHWVTTQAANGRTLQTGMAIFGHTPLDPNIRIAVFSLFTNNDPSDVAGFQAATKATMNRLGSNRCAVWFTIRHPAVHGVTFRKANDALLELAADPAYGGRLIVVPWDATIEARPDLLTSDQIHPTPTGNDLRTKLMADAVNRCPVGAG